MGHIGPPIAALFPMAPRQQARNQKILKTVNAIKECGWRSTNDFLEAFYGSSEAAQSLRYQSGSSYGPERILTSWMSNVPLWRCKGEIVPQYHTESRGNYGLRVHKGIP